MGYAEHVPTTRVWFKSLGHLDFYDLKPSISVQSQWFKGTFAGFSIMELVAVDREHTISKSVFNQQLRM
jgi:hypothetical protein